MTDNDAAELICQSLLVQLRDEPRTARYWPTMAQGLTFMGLRMERIDETVPGHWDVYWSDGTIHTVPLEDHSEEDVQSYYMEAGLVFAIGAMGDSLGL